MKENGFSLWLAGIAGVVVLSACDTNRFDLGENTAVVMGKGSSQRNCLHRNQHNNAYFGDLHVHTAYSADGYNWGVRNTPQDAYRYAFDAGDVLLPPNDEKSGKGMRAVRIDRPLDFAGVTDHAEFYGEVRLCTTPGSPSYNSEFCDGWRGTFGRDFKLAARIFSPIPWRSGDDVCGNNGMYCMNAAAETWQDIIQAAEDWNDNSENCERTAFVAYEYSSMRSGSNLHRNVIFRNAIVPPQPISFIEAPREWELWEKLNESCNDTDTGCQAFAIPHNSNISNGRMFKIDYPETSGVDEERARAALRIKAEPIIEIMQHKGDSECRNGVPGVMGGEDELCNWEKFEDLAFQATGGGDNPSECWEGPLTDFFFRLGPACINKRSYARYALVEGLKEEERLGVNPFKFGLSASTDTHNGLAGGVQERDFNGHLGMGDDINSKRVQWTRDIAGNSSNGPGGIIGVWAPQNTRDDLFDAMIKKEVFGTSGPRIQPRFFGGSFPDSLCDDPELLAKAYANGVPMGQDLPQLKKGQAPTFVAMAIADTGSKEYPGVPLQRLQVIKGWSDTQGNTHQRIFDVAGTAENSATVDLNTCQPQGEGFAQLCSIWKDPEFDPAIRAVYYMRAIENPTCRYTGWQCLEIPETERPEECNDTVPSAPMIQQERAWTSPIWYTPYGKTGETD